MLKDLNDISEIAMPSLQQTHRQESLWFWDMFNKISLQFTLKIWP